MLFKVKDISDLNILDFFNEGAILHDGDRIYYSNDQIRCIFKAEKPTQEKISCEKIHKLLYAVKKHFETSSEEPYKLEFNVLLKSDGRKKFNTRSHVVDYNGEKIFLTIFEDVTSLEMIDNYIKKFNIVKKLLEMLKVEDINLPLIIGEYLYESVRKLLPDVWLYIGSVYEDKLIVDFGKVENIVLKGFEVTKDKKGILWYMVNKNTDIIYLKDLFAFEEDEFKPINLGISEDRPISYYGLLVRTKEIRGFLSFMRRGYDAFSEEERNFFNMLKDQVELSFRISEMAEELEKEKFKYKELAMKDALTGAYTRHFFNEWMKKHEELIARKGSITSIILIDLDDFKKINDKYGHVMGDIVLREFVATIKEKIRAMDMVVRYGGDEFLIVLPEAPKSTAINILSRIKNALKDLSKRIGVNISISSGISFITKGKKFPQVLEEADKILYEMKENRRK